MESYFVVIEVSDAWDLELLSPVRFDASYQTGWFSQRAGIAVKKLRLTTSDPWALAENIASRIAGHMRVSRMAVRFWPQTYKTSQFIVRAPFVYQFERTPI